MELERGQIVAKMDQAERIVNGIFQLQRDLFNGW
jgi:hypothetical protein